MKTKRLITLAFYIGITSFGFVSSVLALPYSKQKQSVSKKLIKKKTIRIASKENEAQELEQYLDLTAQTPSQLSATALRVFFEQSYRFLSLSNRNGFLSTSTSDLTSKRTLFNHSLSEFVLRSYNSERYTDMISRDSTHFIEFLKISNDIGFDIEMVYTCQRLLFNKLKYCEIVDFTVVQQLSKTYPNLLAQYFKKSEHALPSREFIQKMIDGMMLDKFTNHLPFFHKEPDVFITELAGEIADFTHIHLISNAERQHEEAMRERLRATIKQLFEVALGRMMWDAVAYQSVKPSFIVIGNGIVQLAERGIIDHMDDLDDLLTTLNSRLCFFLEVYGSVMPLPMLDEMLNSISKGEIFFLELPEQDPEVTPKKEILVRALLKAKTKAIALEHGIHSDQAAYL